MKARKTAALLAFTLLFNTLAVGGVTASAADNGTALPAIEDDAASPAAVKLEFEFVFWTPNNGAGWRLKNSNIDQAPEYVVNLYKNGVPEKEYRITRDYYPERLWYDPEAKDGFVYFGEEMKNDPSSEYTFDVTAIGDGKETLDSDTVKMDTAYLYKGESTHPNVSAAVSNKGNIELMLMNSPILYAWYCDYDESFFEKTSQAKITEGLDLAGGLSGELINLKPIKSGSMILRFDFCERSTKIPYESVIYRINIDENMMPEICMLDSGTEYVFGDADADGILTSSDVAVVMQKVLTDKYIMPLENVTPYYMEYLDVDCDFRLTATDAAMIMQKVLVSSIVMPIEKKIDAKALLRGSYALE